MTEQDFIGGCKYFMQSIGFSRFELIIRCKLKYPALNGRGVNFVIVPTKWLGVNWRWGFFVDPGRILISKERLLTEEIFDKDKPLDPENMDLVIKAIDDYNPDTQLLWCFICNLPTGGGCIQIFTNG